MKNLIFTILSAAFFTATLFPSPALALVDGYSDSNECKPNTYVCSCLFQGGTAEQVQGTYDGASCSAHCSKRAAEITNGVQTTASYTLSCTNLAGHTRQVDSGTVDALLREQADGAATIQRDPIFPTLNVPLPGFNPAGTIVIDQETGIQHSNLLGAYIQAAYSFLILAGSLIAVTMIMIGGLQYAVARGDSNIVSQAKQRIERAVVGIILLLLAYNFALLVDPATVDFDPLSIKALSRVESFPPEGEDLNITPNLSLSGNVVPVTGDAIIAGNDVFVDPDTLTALQNAAIAFNQKTGKNVLVASGARDLRQQVTLFYNNCIVPGGVCSVPTCNPAYDSPLIKKVGAEWQLQGELETERNAAVIIGKLTEVAKYGNCPHTSGIAVDAWCHDGSMNFAHDPACQQELIKTMTENSFCRLGSEVWHFELNSKKVSTGCYPTNNTIQYISRNGPQMPPENCARWDFKNHTCVLEKPVL